MVANNVVATPSPIHDTRQAPLPDISGVWIKDHELSDPMQPAMELMRLNGLMRTAIRLVKGMRVALDEQNFELALFSAISWFKIRESYKLDGTVSEFRRRDFRRGKMVGEMRATPHGTLLLPYKWPEPLGGSGEDEFKLTPEGQLHVVTRINVGDQSVCYTQIYNRRA